MEVISGGQARPSLLALIYGQSKTYKTSTYLCAPPELRPMAVLDAERGAKIRLQILSMTQEQRKALGISENVPEWYGPWMREGIDFYYPSTANWFGDCHQFCSDIAHSGKYKLVVLDTLTAIATKILNEVKHLQYEGTSKSTKRIHLKAGNVETVHATMNDYGFAQDRVEELIVAADDSPAHLLMISHEKTGQIEDVEEKVKRIIAGPSTIGNAQIERIPSACDLVFRLETQAYRTSDQKLGQRTILRTRNHGFYLAGDRSGLFTDGEVHDAKVFWERILAFMTLAGEGAPPSKVERKLTQAEAVAAAMSAARK